MTSLVVHLELPPDVVERIIAEVTRRAIAALGDSAVRGRWLCGARAAAEYLGCSPRRVYARLDQIPHKKDDGRLMFFTAELDAWLRGLS